MISLLISYDRMWFRRGPLLLHRHDLARTFANCCRREPLGDSILIAHCSCWDTFVLTCSSVMCGAMHVERLPPWWRSLLDVSHVLAVVHHRKVAS